MRNTAAVHLFLMTLPAFIGCSAMNQSAKSQHAANSHVSLSYGQPRPVVDTIGWVWGIPKKIILWDRRIENHAVSDDTVDRVASYLEDNNLHNVHVRVNEYNPVDEWRRLRDNDRVGPGWRYTVGLLHLAGYTVFPGRVFGGDRYNPYTNSLYVYSDAAPMGVAEAAYAKDIHQRSYPGTYAFTQEFPVLALWHETIATRDALNYVHAQGAFDELDEAYRILYPRYGYAAGAAVSDVLPVLSPGPEVVGALVGHASGRYQLNHITNEQQPQTMRAQSEEIDESRCRKSPPPQISSAMND